ncbi:MAG: hypothetical protein FWF99_01270 [Desulfovibrionaceae bacterium]|nr:hypothetical protein [Desulfovibrionaceae bacterium]
MALSVDMGSSCSVLGRAATDNKKRGQLQPLPRLGCASKSVEDVQFRAALLPDPPPLPISGKVKVCAYVNLHVLFLQKITGDVNPPEKSGVSPWAVFRGATVFQIWDLPGERLVCMFLGEGDICEQVGLGGIKK